MKPSSILRVAALGTALATGMATAEDTAPATTAAATPGFTALQIEELVAPIALYPDTLAIQVLMAATYPLEIVEADRWRAKNATLQGADLDKALEGQSWDPSVSSLTRFPDLLKRMSENLDWTKDLGDAFLSQKDDVLNTIQRMRAKAIEAGTLKTTPEQVVTKEVVNNKEIVTITPAQPDVVYVPTYAPSQAYGSTWSSPAPAYPAMYTYPPGYVATTSLLSFGVGMAVGAAISGGCDWDDNDVHVYHHGGGGGGNNNSNNNINIDNSKNVNIGKIDKTKWEHKPEHRGGVRYPNESTANRFGGASATKPAARPAPAHQDLARGRPQAPAGGRQPSRPSGNAQRPAAPSTRPATPSRQPSAMGGYERGGNTREASARGSASRGTPSYAGRGAGSSSGARTAGSSAGRSSGGSRGGGGGGRGGGGGGGRRGGGRR